MDKKSFLQAGHTPTLIAAFLYFDLAFMVWVLLGPLAVGIAADLGLSHAQVFSAVTFFVGIVPLVLRPRKKAPAH